MNFEPIQTPRPGRALFNLSLPGAALALSLSACVNPGGGNMPALAPEAAHNLVQTLSHKPAFTLVAKEMQPALTATIAALNQGLPDLGTDSEVQAALDGLGQGNTTAAKALFSRHAENPSTPSPLAAEAYAHWAALVALENPQQALDLVRKATQKSPGQTQIWQHFGDLARLAGQPEQAMNAFQKALALAKTQNNLREQAASHRQLARAYQERGDFGLALDNGNQALKIYETLGDRQAQADTLAHLALIRQAQGETDQAAALLQKNLNLNNSLGNQAALAKTYGQLGAAYFAGNRDDAAYENYQTALQRSEKLGDAQGVAEQYEHLGDIYQKRGDLSQTIAYYQKALPFYQKIGHQTGTAQVYRNLGIIYKIQLQHDKSIAVLDKALLIDQQLGDKNGMAIDHNNLGYNYHLMGNINKAKQHYLQSLELFRQLNSEDAEPVEDLLESLNGNIGSAH